MPQKALFNKVDDFHKAFKEDIVSENKKLQNKIDNSAVTRGVFPIMESYNSGNLIINGHGEFGNSQGLLRFLPETVDTNGAKCAFTTSTLNADFQVDELIAVEPGARYRFQYDIKTANKVGKSLYYPYIASYDVEHNHISNHHIPMVVFKLAADWHSTQGNLTIAPEDRAKFNTFWNAWGSRATHYLICEDSYTNRYGYKHPVGKYTRKYYTSNYFLKDSSYNNSTGVLSSLRLYAPHFPTPSKKLDAGTTLTITVYGATYSYFQGFTNVPVSEEWTTVKHEFKIEDMTRPETSIIRPGWLLNRESQAGNRVILANVGLYQLE